MEEYVIHGPPEPIKPPTSGSPAYGERLLNNLERGGNNIALVSNATNETITFNEIRERAIRLAVALQKLGVKKGDCVAISSENRFEFAVCSVAVVAVGAVIATLNIMYTKAELVHVLKISKPVLIFASPFTLHHIMGVKKNIPTIKSIISFGEDRLDASVILLRDLLDRQVDIAGFKPAKVDVQNHPAAILCSSGTTGLPKGVVLNQKNFIIKHDHLFSSLADAKPIILSVVPWFHAYGFVTLLGGLYVNMKMVFLVKFEEEAFLSAFQKHKITVTMIVPPLMVFLAKHPLVDKYDFSTLEQIWCGAAPLSKEIQEAVIKRIGVDTIRQAYGMTETTLGVLVNYGDKGKHASCGQLVPGTKAKVVDLTTGKSLGPFKEGELCFKGPLMMKGYLGDTASTENIFDSDGWMHTGDVGYYDNDEYFYIVDRIKELIKYNSYQVPPAELEAILLTHPSVKDAAVIGKPDERAGELPMAFISKQPNSKVSEQELIDYVAKRVSRQKWLHGGVRFIDEIPKNPSGKILRRQLRDLINKQQSKL